MKTKTIDIAEVVAAQQNTKKEKQLKKIKFEKFLDEFFKKNKPISKPNYFKVIELLVKNYSYSQDLMLAYDDDRTDGILYIGQWNDGVV